MMVVTKLKMVFQKMKPYIVVYRNYKPFDNEKFWSDIQSIFNKNATIKRKYDRANEASFGMKDLRKAIMKRSSLRKKYLKTKSVTDRKKS